MEVLIVDDEKEIRKGLVHTIDWKTLGFTQVYDADDGETALEVVEERNPSLIVTDIRMARMSGLELIRELSLKGYKGNIIIISGYDDFHYAKEAFKLGIEDYLLKPIDIPEFIRAVRSVKERWNQKQMDQHSQSLLHQSFKQALTKLRESTLQELIGRVYRQGVEVRIEYKLLQLELEWMLSQQLYVVVFGIDNLRSLLDGQSEGEKEFLLFSVGNLLEHFWAEQSTLHSVVFRAKNDHLVCVLGCVGLEGQLNWEELVSEACERVLKFGKIQVSAGIAFEPGMLDRLFFLNQNAAESLISHKIRPKSLMKQSDVDHITGDEAAYLLSKPKEFIGLLKYGSEQEIKDAMEYYPTLVQLWQVTSPRSLQQHTFEWLLELFRTAQKTGWANQEWEKNPIALWEQLERFDTLESLQQQVTHHLLLMAESMQKHSVSRNQIILEAERYMLEHFNENLTLQAVADHVHVTSVWLSKLFKKETGMNFLEYVTDIRLTKAAELLKNLNYKVYQICTMVGYQDPVYFSRQFKKKYGSTPYEYRNQRGTDDV
ncbi:MAG: hypothetical protein K0R67_3694 [Paenibacillus sp.]|jgi:two-component system response regulator YesN|nr:hypothetical protein [Paenibacillus sp.]